MSSDFRLQRLVATDARDAGCAEAFEHLEAFAERSGDVDPAVRWPGVAAHLSACSACALDLQGLIAAICE